jgi:hypothetical protein
MPKPITIKRFAQPFTANDLDVMDFLFPVRTATEIADVTDPINTQNKFHGRQVYDSTNQFMYVADGPAVDDTWTLNDGLGATQVTPS